MSKRRYLFLRHCLYVSACVGIWVIYSISGIGCPIRFFFGFPCPACGISRSLLALLHGDFAGYMQYNPMAAFLLIAVLLAFHLKRLGRFRTLANIYIFSALGVNLVIYLIRYFF